ncbi:hypothetical protein WMF39_36305 [Sorangium sp. So ce1504]|uniref:hypothetical protein n=1 Tax=Sorangium sp. So ce1504 TaxID=3133337 RepID=UPI003F60B37E
MRLVDGETGENHGNRYCFRRPIVINRFFWRDESVGANRRDPVLCPGFQGGVTTDRSPSVGVGPTRAQPASLDPGKLASADASPRLVVVASLAGTLNRAVALGDEEAARIVHEAIGRLLGLVPAPERRERSRRR